MHPEKVDSAWRPELRETVVRLVRSDEQPRYQELVREHHYLGPSAQDRRNAVVRGELAGAMGCAVELFGLSPKWPRAMAGLVGPCASTMAA